jgi:hypothetical protein
VLNKASLHEDIGGVMVYGNVFLTSALDGGHQLHAPAALLWEKSSAYPMDRRLDGYRTGLDAVEKKNLAPAENRDPHSCP